MREPEMTSPLSSTDQVLLVGLLSLNFGILFFDRNALNFLMPFVAPDLGLTNTEVGYTASALSFTWAVSSFLVGSASDRSGRRKAYLVGTTIAFSVCSFLSGLAGTFLTLLAARLLMGVAEGGVLPISQSITAASVSANRRGVAMGVMQNFGSNLFGSFLAPVLLVAFATSFGWHRAFFIAGAPGLISALLLWRFVREAAPTPLPDTTAPIGRSSPGHFLGNRNMVLCALIAVLLVSYLVICWAFMPLFLVQVRKFSPQTMGWLMGTLGISSTLGSFIVPGISDRIGRKPVMIMVPLLGLILPIGAIYYTGSAWGLAGIFFVGWALNGVFPMFMGTIPSESVAPRHVATAMGFIMGTGEILGGTLSPAIAGWSADKAGLAAPLWIMAAFCTIAALLALGLQETAPRILSRRVSQTPAQILPT